MLVCYWRYLWWLCAFGMRVWGQRCKRKFFELGLRKKLVKVGCIMTLAKLGCIFVQVGKTTDCWWWYWKLALFLCLSLLLSRREQAISVFNLFVLFFESLPCCRRGCSNGVFIADKQLKKMLVEHKKVHLSLTAFVISMAKHVMQAQDQPTDEN